MEATLREEVVAEEVQLGRSRSSQSKEWPVSHGALGGYKKFFEPEHETLKDPQQAILYGDPQYRHLREILEKSGAPHRASQVHAFLEPQDREGGSQAA
jgi:hypothetical protein